MPGQPGHFGPAIIGQEQYDREQALVAKGADKFGPLVTGIWPEGHPDAPKAAEPEQPKTPAQVAVKLEELRGMLDANPFILDGLIDAEFARPEGPRKGALRLFIEVEKAKVSPEARADVVMRLAKSLEDLG